MMAEMKIQNRFHMKKLLLAVSLTSCLSVVIGLFLGLSINFFNQRNIDNNLRHMIQTCIELNSVIPLKQAIKGDLLVLEILHSDDSEAKSELYKALYQNMFMASADIADRIQNDLSEAEVKELEDLNNELIRVLTEYPSE